MTASPEIRDYYKDTLNRDIRADLRFATSLISDINPLAIDCGCGEGADIAYLRSQDFTVHAFDFEEEAIRICSERFADDAFVYLSQDSFASFNYPQADLIVADASLFFCPPEEFDKAWSLIRSSLKQSGVFCGSFLGPEDTMAKPEFAKEAFWLNVLTFQEEEIRSEFNNFKIMSFEEHKHSGLTPSGIPHDWHIYSVVARKC